MNRIAMRVKFFPRFFALFLSLCLGLPQPVYCLRTTNAGLETSPVRRELENRFQGGLETDPQEPLILPDPAHSPWLSNYPSRLAAEMFSQAKQRGLKSLSLAVKFPDQSEQIIADLLTSNLDEELDALRRVAAQKETEGDRGSLYVARLSQNTAGIGEGRLGVTVVLRYKEGPRLLLDGRFPGQGIASTLDDGAIQQWARQVVRLSDELAPHGGRDAPGYLEQLLIRFLKGDRTLGQAARAAADFAPHLPEWEWRIWLSAGWTMGRRGILSAEPFVLGVISRGLGFPQNRTPPTVLSVLSFELPLSTESKAAAEQARSLISEAGVVRLLAGIRGPQAGEGTTIPDLTQSIPRPGAEDDIGGYMNRLQAYTKPFLLRDSRFERFVLMIETQDGRIFADLKRPDDEIAFLKELLKLKLLARRVREMDDRIGSDNRAWRWLEPEMLFADEAENALVLKLRLRSEPATLLAAGLEASGEGTSPDGADSPLLDPARAERLNVLRDEMLEWNEPAHIRDEGEADAQEEKLWEMLRLSAQILKEETNADVRKAARKAQALAVMWLSGLGRLTEAAKVERALTDPELPMTTRLLALAGTTSYRMYHLANTEVHPAAEMLQDILSLQAEAQAYGLGAILSAADDPESRVAVAEAGEGILLFLLGVAARPSLPEPISLQEESISEKKLRDTLRQLLPSVRFRSEDAQRSLMEDLLKGDRRALLEVADVATSLLLDTARRAGIRKDVSHLELTKTELTDRLNRHPGMRSYDRGRLIYERRPLVGSGAPLAAAPRLEAAEKSSRRKWIYGIAGGIAGGILGWIGMDQAASRLDLGNNRSIPAPRANDLGFVDSVGSAEAEGIRLLEPTIEAGRMTQWRAWVDGWARDHPRYYTSFYEVRTDPSGYASFFVPLETAEGQPIDTAHFDYLRVKLPPGEHVPRPEYRTPVYENAGNLSRIQIRPVTERPLRVRANEKITVTAPFKTPLQTHFLGMRIADRAAPRGVVRGIFVEVWAANPNLPSHFFLQMDAVRTREYDDFQADAALQRKIQDEQQKIDAARLASTVLGAAVGWMGGLSVAQLAERQRRRKAASVQKQQAGLEAGRSLGPKGAWGELNKKYLWGVESPVTITLADFPRGMGFPDGTLEQAINPQVEEQRRSIRHFLEGLPKGYLLRWQTSSAAPHRLSLRFLEDDFSRYSPSEQLSKLITVGEHIVPTKLDDPAAQAAPEVRVVSMRRDDVEQFLELQSVAGEFAIDQPLLFRLARRIWYRTGRAPGGIELYKAIGDQGRFAGSMICLREKAEEGPGELTIVDIAVAPGFRKEGVSRAFVALLHRGLWAGDRIQTYVRRGDKKTRGFFRKLGFEEEEIVPGHFGDQDGVRMVRAARTGKVPTAGLEALWMELRSAVERPGVVVVELEAIGDPAARRQVAALARIEPNLLLYAGLETAARLAGMEATSVRFVGSAETERTLTRWVGQMGISVVGERPGSRLLLQVLTRLGIPEPVAASGLEALSQALGTLAPAA